ncbi:Ig-like domain-containing protein, partial [Buttiauxella warmboldiae]
AALNEGSNDVQVMVTGTDNAGNTAIAVEHKTVVLDTQAHNGVNINTVAGDDIVSFGESKHETLITGQVSGKDAKAGDSVNVLVQGKYFSGTVVADADGRLHYEVKVPSHTLQEGKNDVTVTVISHDNVGNEAIAVEHKNVTLDTHADATIALNDVTQDNQLSHAELETPKQLISGEVGGDARVGDKVSIEINGHYFGGQVIDLGAGKLGYQIPVDSSVFADNQAQVNGDVTVTASVTSHDAVNNEVTQTTTHTVHVDNFATTGVHIGTVAGDNIINMIESRMPTFISGGVSDDAKAGDPVVVSVNGKDYAGEVKESSGHLYYEVAVPTGDLHEGSNDVQVTIVSHDALGNEATATEHKIVTVDTHAEATISINGVTKDNVLNHAELNQKTHTISGVVGGDAKVGDEVTLDINGKHFTGYVEMINGKPGYQIPVDSSAFSNNRGNLDTDVNFTARIISHDAAGNEVIQITDRIVHIDNHAENALTINQVAGDDTISMNESRMPTLISGDVTGVDAKAGDKVVVRVQGHNYNGVVVADVDGHLRYEVAVPGAQFHEGKNDVKVTVTSHDAAGNVATATEHHNVTLDTQAQATISLGSVTVDNTLNHDELDAPQQLISGTVGGDAKPGDEVVIDINGHRFTGNVIDLGNGKPGFQILVDSSAFSDNQGNIDSQVHFTATVTSFDDVKNEVIVTTDHTVKIDNHAEAHITMDTVSGDKTINLLESRQQFTKVSGTVSGVDVHDGDKVIVMVNGQTYETTVHSMPQLNGGLGYSLNIVTSDLVADPHPTAHVVGYDSVGNQQRAEVTQNLDVDLHADATITINPVTGDNMINGAESKQEFTEVTGKVGGDVKVGDLVHLYVNGQDLTGRVFRDPVSGDLEYKIKASTHDLMADPKLTATVTATDQANNTVTVEAKQDIVIDTRVEAQITVDSVTLDNTLNDEELNHHYTLVSGTVKGEMHIGDPLTLTVNNHVYQGTVEDLGQGLMGYHILVETTDIHQDPNIHASISVTDLAQNSTVATNNHHVDIDERAEASVTINIVSGDDVLNEHDQTLASTTINGRVGGDVAAGNIVNVTVDGQVYHAVVGPQAFLGGGLGYSIDVPTQGLLHDPKIIATVNVQDGAGNTITAGATHSVSRDDHAVATITIDPVTDDNFINYSEAHQDHTAIIGQVTGDVHIGDRVELTVNGQHYYGNVISQGKGLGYSINVNTSDLLSGTDKPVIHAEVTGYDAAGNTVLATDDHTVGIDTHADVHITDGSGLPEKPNGPDFYIVTGHVDGSDVKINDTITYDFMGKTHTTPVVQLPDGTLGYKFYVSAGDAIAHPDIVLSLTKTDDHGNTATSRFPIHMDVPPIAGSNTGNNNANNNSGHTTLPHITPPDAHITINPVAGNDVINKTESQASQTVIRGTVTGDVHIGDRVTVHIGNTDYNCAITERPNLPGELGYEVYVDTANLLANPNITASVTAHNGPLSQVFEAHKPVGVDTDVAVSIHLDNIADDDKINIAESKNGTTTVSGTVTGDVNDGDNVTITVNGHQVTAQVHQDPNTGIKTFTKEVSIDDLRQNTLITASVTGHDSEGNTATASDHKDITVDTFVEAEVTVDKVTADNTLNLLETQHDKTEVSGTVKGDVKPGEEVTLTVNNHQYHATIDGNLNYKVEIDTADLQADHKIEAEVTGHDDAGNTITTKIPHSFSVDTQADATLKINTVSGDDTLSAKDLSNGKTEISGVVEGDAAVGDKVTITVNGHDTVVNVIELPKMNGQLGYTALVDTIDLQNDPHVYVSVTGEDSVGNVFEAHMDKTLKIDDHAEATLHVIDVSGDNVLNAAESSQQKTAITGTVSGDVQVGDKVTVTVNGNDLAGTIEKDGNGHLSFKVMVDTVDLIQDQHITYKVTGVDGVGNTVTIVEENTIDIDKVASNSIHIDTISGDDKVNSVESKADTTTITGTVTGDASAGDPVTLTVNGKTFQGVVVDQNGHLTYSVEVKNSALQEGDNSVMVSVTGHDAAGNPATSSDNHSVTLDTQISATITLDPV